MVQKMKLKRFESVKNYNFSNYNKEFKKYSHQKMILNYKI